jgi:hypothetical protein
METNSHVPPVDVYRRSDGSLGDIVYQKYTHVNLYLSCGPHHHPPNKQPGYIGAVLCD